MFLELDHVMATDQHFRQFIEASLLEQIAWQTRECFHIEICKISSELNFYGLNLPVYMVKTA